jgi:hypothetical protein
MFSNLVRIFKEHWPFFFFFFFFLFLKTIYGTRNLWLKILLSLCYTVIIISFQFWGPLHILHEIVTTSNFRRWPVSHTYVVMVLRKNVVSPQGDFRGFSRSERLTGVSRKTAENIHVLRFVTPCILAQMCRRFSETSVYFYQRQVSRPVHVVCLFN